MEKEEYPGKGRDHLVPPIQEVDQEIQEIYKNEGNIHEAEAEEDQHQAGDHRVIVDTRKKVKANDDQEAEKDQVQVKRPLLKLIKLEEKRQIFRSIRRKIRRKRN